MMKTLGILLRRGVENGQITRRLVSFNDEIESLYSEIPIELKKKYCLPSEFVEFYSRAEALFGTDMNFQGNYS